MSYWHQWISQPQNVWLRRAIFQVHLWSGIGIGLYVFMISVTGSILVYRNELFVAATRDPIVLVPAGPRLSDDELKTAALRAHAGYAVAEITGGQKPDQPVTIALRRDTSRKDRFFNPYTGEDLGDTVPFGIHAVSRLLELHDDLLGGQTGRSINGIFALLLIVLAGTGIVVWWPGIRSWRRSLVIHRNTGWRRLTWDLHSMIGFWTFGIIMLFAVSGVYLAYPEAFQTVADRIQPPTDTDLGNRFVDQVIYWLAYLHFGRINGIGIPCHGPGLCDQATKFTWAFFGLAPAAMFLTGIVMWWNRVLRKKFTAARDAVDKRPAFPRQEA